MLDNDELVNLRRSVIQEEMQSVRQEVRAIVQEELKPVHQELQEFREEANARLDKLEKGQKKLQKDVTTIKNELCYMWRTLSTWTTA